VIERLSGADLRRSICLARAAAAQAMRDFMATPRHWRSRHRNLDVLLFGLERQEHASPPSWFLDCMSIRRDRSNRVIGTKSCYSPRQSTAKLSGANRQADPIPFSLAHMAARQQIRNAAWLASLISQCIATCLGCTPPAWPRRGCLSGDVRFRSLTSPRHQLTSVRACGISCLPRRREMR
jgi:hypothetical protein